jgi:multidrug efflux system outer membrane protein
MSCTAHKRPAFTPDTGYIKTLTIIPTRRNHPLMRITIALLFIVALAGCRTPAIDSAESQVSPPATWIAAHAQADDVQPAWIASFDSPELANLVQAGIAGNHDLQATAATLQAAAARHRIADDGRYPELDVNLNGDKSKRNSSGGVSITSARTTSLGINLSAAWELDVWGRIRSQTAAAHADYEASQADYQAARLSLAAQIAKGWFGTATARRQVDLSRQTLASFEKSQQIIEDRFRDGLTSSSSLDVRLGRANVAAARSRLAASQRVQQAAVRRLEVLLGQYPGATLATAGTLPHFPTQAPVGLPASLLSRRPDIAAAARRVESAEFATDAARKARLPAIRLTGSRGTASDEFQELLNSNFLVWNIAGGLTQPLFNAGELKARVNLEEALRDADLAAFANTVLQAFHEVETALDAEVWLQQQEQALQVSVTESVEAETIAMEQYGDGIIDIATLLVSQRRVFDARDALIQIRNQRLQNRVDLHLALAGDFE